MKVIHIAIGLILLGCMSCSSDDDGNVTGKWSLESMTFDCPDDFNMDLTINASDGCVLVENEATCISFEFKNNGTGILTFGSSADNQTSAFTYVVDDVGSQVEICSSDDADECSTLVLRNNRLTLEDFEEGCDVNYSFARN